MATVDLRQLIDILPQKYPFLMIDSIVAYEEGVSLTAVKNITGSEWIYDGGRNSLDGKFPETLIMEAAAQTALVLYHVEMILSTTRKVIYRLGKISSEFSDMTECGDQIFIEAYPTKLLRIGGFSEIVVRRLDKEIANIFIFYSVTDL